MRMHFRAIDGAPCWRCAGTVYNYTVDEYVTYIAASCVACRADNMFYPPKGCSVDTPMFAATAHRESQSPIAQTVEPFDLSN